MAEVPREFFVPVHLRSAAYEDTPLPIGEGQTISQPFMVALMTEALELRGDEHVLEVGTGSGYQAAILSRLAASVVTVERFPTLAATAAERLRALGCTNVVVYVADPQVLGWPPNAPYDAILVTAGAPRVPQSLVEQLASGGRLVIPVGSETEQMLYRVRRQDSGLTYEELGQCRFVPLIGPEAWPERGPGNE